MKSNGPPAILPPGGGFYLVLLSVPWRRLSPGESLPVWRWVCTFSVRELQLPVALQGFLSMVPGSLLPCPNTMALSPWVTRRLGTDRKPLQSWGASERRLRVHTAEAGRI